jgi:monofunctional biosynthetic peptidoglycan transglycosylase
LSSKAARNVRPKAAPVRRRGLFGRIVRAIVMLGVVFLLIGPIVVTAIYRFAPPPITFLMVERVVQGQGLDRRWKPMNKMSPALVRAVIASEDARFCSHHGFDFNAIDKAMQHNERRPDRVRGGSTISQQTAKNVFLWPERSYVRKGLEAYFTVLIETLWGKRRIMEVYLNSIEWGPGIYGAEAAARRNFGIGADRLDPVEASRLASILPKPLAWRADRPGPRMLVKSGRVARSAGTVRRDGLAACVLN